MTKAENKTWKKKSFILRRESEVVSNASLQGGRKKPDSCSVYAIFERLWGGWKWGNAAASEFNSLGFLVWPLARSSFSLYIKKDNRVAVISAKNHKR